MNLDLLFQQKKRKLNSLVTLRRQENVSNRTCGRCGAIYSEKMLEENLWVCPGCGCCLTMTPWQRIQLIADDSSFSELYKNVQTKNPIQFPDYEKKLRAESKKTGQRDAIVTGVCQIDRQKLAIGVLNPAFMMGSMGTVVGEKIVRITEYAMRRKLPLLIVSASGGARMQEGLFSLMQMARTAAVITRFQEQGGLFLSMLTNPTTGGVSASYASLGNIMIAEPGALIGFAGPRVIEQTIGQTLPDGFQRAEFLQEHGMIDLILKREEQRQVLSKILSIHDRSSH